MDSSLKTAASAYLAPLPEALGYGEIALAQAALGLSPETVQAQTTARSEHAELNAQYGLDSNAEWGPVPGTVTVAIVDHTAIGSGTRTAYGSRGKGQQS